MLKILVVDDESINRIMLCEMLRDAGNYDILEAENGQQAIELAREVQPDMVLLDVIMPGLSGIDVAPVIKAMSPDCYLPVLFITSLDDEKSLTRCLESGGDDFISKPFEKSVLRAKVDAHARSRRLSLEIKEKNKSLTYYQREVERNHRIVEHIFDNALSQEADVVRYFDVYSQPEAQFNGDLFLCEKSPAGGVYLFVGDFTGHGLASAIGAIPIAQAFTVLTQRGLAVEEISVRLNSILYSLLPADMFCVATIIEISQRGTHFTVWSGGLPRMVLKDNQQRLKSCIEPQHMPLGILSPSEFDKSCQIYEAELGDTLLAYTDGLMESCHPEFGMLGEEGVESWFIENEDVSALSLVNSAVAYRGQTAAEDDMTIVLYRCQPFSLKVPEEQPEAIIPFNLSFHLTAEHFRDFKLIDHMLQIVNNINGLAAVRSEIFTILTELLNNAIEHGILGMSSELKADPDGFLEYYQERQLRLSELQDGNVWVSFIVSDDKPGKLVIIVKDSGKGFDVTSIRAEEDATFGRGIPLLTELCESVEFNQSGNEVSVILAL